MPRNTIAAVVFFFALAIIVVAVSCIAASATATSLFNSKKNKKVSPKQQHPGLTAKHSQLKSSFENVRRRFLNDDGTFKHDHERAVPSKKVAAAVDRRDPMLHNHPPTPGSNNRSKAPFGVNVMDYGANPDGKTDNTAAFAAAIAAGKGGRVEIPAGSYVFDLNGTAGINVPAGTQLVGVNEAPFRDWDSGGTTLIVRGQPVSASQAFIRMYGPDATVAGIAIFYANQVAGSASTPLVFGPTIQGQGSTLTVCSVLLANPYYGIDFATYPCARHLIQGVYGQPLYLGIASDRVYDIERTELVHFWPFCYSYIPSNAPIFGFIMTQATSIKIMRSDWFEIEDLFSWGYNIGLHLAVSPHSEVPNVSNGQASLLNFDNVHIGIKIDGTQPPGLQVSNFNVANAGNQARSSAAISCASGATSDTQVVVRGLSVWGQFNKIVDWGCSGKVTVSDFVASAWSRNACAFDIRSGRAMITHGYFADSIGCAVNITEGVDRAVVSTNDLVGNSVNCFGSNRLCANNLP